MAAIPGSGDGSARDVQLNIVPMIDLMSCLTAFLLVAAVWVDMARLDVTPKGRSRTADVDRPEEVVLSVLVQKDRIWLGASRTGEQRWLDRGDPGVLAATLAELKASPELLEQRGIELAADSATGREVVYQDLVAVMSAARAAGFEDIGVTDLDGLTTRPMF